MALGGAKDGIEAGVAQQARMTLTQRGTHGYRDATTLADPDDAARQG